MLMTHEFGAEFAGPPVLIVHGLYGSARNWRAIAKRLARARRVVTVDMRNHGESPRFDSHSYPELADDLAEVITHFGGLADVVGHSMGGKASMALALRSPELVRRLLVADIAPVAYGHDQTQFIDAMETVDPTQIQSRYDADAALAGLVDDAGVRAFLLQSLDLKSDPHRWVLNLPVLRAEMPKIIGWPDITGAFDGPTLFLTGANSDYVTPDHRGVIRDLFPQARFAKLAGAGHWLHAEKPNEFMATIDAFFPKHG
jgi:esterase